ncbi:MAG: hypothetical protein ACP5KW_06640 [Thermoproteota archaeon]|jgi:uncharacterized protein (DUF433 family)
MRIEVNEYTVADTETYYGKPTFNGTTKIRVCKILEIPKKVIVLRIY